jgi:hypothetical protein
MEGKTEQEIGEIMHRSAKRLVRFVALKRSVFEDIRLKICGAWIELSGYLQD